MHGLRTLAWDSANTITKDEPDTAGLLIKSIIKYIVCTDNNTYYMKNINQIHNDY